MNNGKALSCGDFELEYPEEAVAIIEKWAEEHPQKTILMDFLEKFPNAKLRNNGIPPGVCPDILGYSKIRRCERSCVDCWNRPI